MILILLLLIAALSPIKYFEFRAKEASFLRIALEYKFADFWVGLFWKVSEVRNHRQLDIWACLIPFFPIHITAWPRSVVVTVDGEPRTVRRGKHIPNEFSKNGFVSVSFDGETTEYHSGTPFVLHGGESLVTVNV